MSYRIDKAVKSLFVNRTRGGYSNEYTSIDKETTAVC